MMDRYARGDRFELEGSTYYQQGRKCGREGCHCQDGEKLHGPYWYRRNEHGRVKYLGVELPEYLTRARDALTKQRASINAKRRELLSQAAALGRLVSSEALQGGDPDIIARFGFAQCLSFLRNRPDGYQPGDRVRVWTDAGKTPVGTVLSAVNLGTPDATNWQIKADRFSWNEAIEGGRIERA